MSVLPLSFLHLIYVFFVGFLPFGSLYSVRRRSHLSSSFCLFISFVSHNMLADCARLCYLYFKHHRGSSLYASHPLIVLTNSNIVCATCLFNSQNVSVGTAYYFYYCLSICTDTFCQPTDALCSLFPILSVPGACSCP